MELLSVNSRHVAVCNNQTNINDCEKLIYRGARRVATMHPYVDECELYSIGYLALGEARMQYNPERNVKFSTFASKYLRGKMLDEIKLLTQTVRIPQRYAEKVCITSYEYSDYDPYSMEAYYDEEEHERLKEAKVRAKKALGLLTSEERFVFDCRMGKEPMAYVTIGSILNCSAQNAQQEYKRGIKKMRRFVESGAMAA